jgi:chaperonin GroES
MDQMTSEDQSGLGIRNNILQDNLAKGMSEEQLSSIGNTALDGFKKDLASRSEWEESLQEWTKLAMQVRENKSFPWRNASNIKFPLLSTAAMQFSARAYPSLVPSNGQVVKARLIGEDPTGQKFELANRVSQFMSWQVMNDMDDWEEDMDRLLLTLPIVGTVFKKTFYSSAKDCVCSKLVMPTDLVVDNAARSLEDAERITETIYLSPRLVKERKLQEVFLDVDLGAPTHTDAGAVDETTPYCFLEQHTYLDLDDDGYPEPYIVTLHKDTGKVVRIVARFDENSIKEMNGKLVAIRPIHYYTKFSFVPNPDGSFYDIGFGILLGPINESINTLINQLVDAGTLSNLQSGFIGKGLRIRTGEQRFSPGEWKPVNATGDDLRKQIVPLPAKEPSNVLFQLMGSLVTSGKELASVAEIFVGKMPGQNTPATTTMAAVEQGMKVFTAVYKRVYRSLDKEFKKIFFLNQKYMDPNTYVRVLDIQVGPSDFSSDSYDICPGADPAAVSQTDKLMKAQALLEMLPLAGPMLDPIEVFRRVFEAQEQPNPEKLFSQQVQQSGQLPPPSPDPKLMAIQAKAEIDQKKAAVDTQQKMQQMELDGRDRQLQLAMKEQEHAQKMEHAAQSAQLKAASDVQMTNIFAAAERAKAMTAIETTRAVGQEKVTQAKELAKSKSQNKSSSTGKATK